MSRGKLGRYMERKIAPFPKVEIETSSYCNRRCPTCVRNSYPDRTKVESWFTENYLPDDVVYNLIDQLEKMSFRGDLGLQHYNEPLLDPRIVNFGKYAKTKNIFNEVSFHTNGDFLAPEMIENLDGVFHRISISLFHYPMHQFKKTKIVLVGDDHITSHFSPKPDFDTLVQRNRDAPCDYPFRGMYVNHLGEFLLCCEDFLGHFDLGNVKDRTLEELWFSEKHQEILLNLEKPNSRHLYPHCAICSRR